MSDYIQQHTVLCMFHHIQNRTHFYNSVYMYTHSQRNIFLHTYLYTYSYMFQCNRVSIR